MKIPVQFLRKRGPKKVPSATFQQISETEASDSQIHSHNLGKKKNFLSGDSEIVPKLDFSVSSGP